jgi:hypothetical protein
MNFLLNTQPLRVTTNDHKHLNFRFPIGILQATTVNFSEPSGQKQQKRPVTIWHLFKSEITVGNWSNHFIRTISSQEMATVHSPDQDIITQTIPIGGRGEDDAPDSHGESEHCSDSLALPIQSAGS